jgi:hypothetical protein
MCEPVDGFDRALRLWNARLVATNNFPVFDVKLLSVAGAGEDVRSSLAKANKGWLHLSGGLSNDIFNIKTVLIAPTQVESGVEAKYIIKSR